MSHYDYVVIGTGSAGAVIANRLTEDPETNIPSGNTNAATIMIGEKAADLIKATDRVRRKNYPKAIRHTAMREQSLA